MTILPYLAVAPMTIFIFVLLCFAIVYIWKNRHELFEEFYIWIVIISCVFLFVWGLTVLIERWGR